MYEEKIVAFLDILGFRERIKRSENDVSSYNLLYAFLDKYRNESHVREIFGPFQDEVDQFDDKDLRMLYATLPYQLTQFSDSFVFSVDSEDQASTQFLPLILADFILSAINLGLLVRGGVSKGLMTHENGGPAFGPALVRAYELESRTAVFGRIVIDDSAYASLEAANLKAKSVFDIGYDGIREMTVASVLRGKYKGNTGDSRKKLTDAVSLFDALIKGLDRESGLSYAPKYVYVQSKLKQYLQEID